MYQIISTKKYKKSVRKLRVSGNFDESAVIEIINTLAKGDPLLPKQRDHKLTGDFKDCRECHIEPDLLLIYKIENNNLLLYLLNIGSHSDLFE